MAAIELIESLPPKALLVPTDIGSVKRGIYEVVRAVDELRANPLGLTAVVSLQLENVRFWSNAALSHIDDYISQGGFERDPINELPPLAEAINLILGEIRGLKNVLGLEANDTSEANGAVSMAALSETLAGTETKPNTDGSLKTKLLIGAAAALGLWYLLGKTR